MVKNPYPEMTSIGGELAEWIVADGWYKPPGVRFFPSSRSSVDEFEIEEMRKHGEWVDLMRKVVPADQKLYTWWSYRARDWALSDRGRRLDHIWSSANLAERLTRIEVLRGARDWERPSDHVPVIARFDLD